MKEVIIPTIDSIFPHWTGLVSVLWYFQNKKQNRFFVKNQETSKEELIDIIQELWEDWNAPLGEQKNHKEIMQIILDNK